MQKPSEEKEKLPTNSSIQLSQHGRRASLLQRQAGRLPRAGRSLTGLSVHTTSLLPPGLGGASQCQPLPAQRPASALSVPLPAVTLVMQTHLPPLSPSWREATGMPTAPSAAVRSPHTPMSIQHSHLGIRPSHCTAATEACCPADGDGRKQTRAAATGHRPANYLDLSTFLSFNSFLFFKTAIYKFFTILLFLETEEVHLFTNRSSLLTSKKNITARKLPQLTNLPQLTTDQMSPNSAVQPPTTPCHEMKWMMPNPDGS